jgi:hypothetical protein
MTLAPFSPEGRGAGWEVGENFKNRLDSPRSQAAPPPVVGSYPATVMIPSPETFSFGSWQSSLFPRTLYP